MPTDDHAVLRVRRSGPLHGTCTVPGDKSISHRALLFGALAGGTVEASGLGLGGDNLSTATALRGLGVDIRFVGRDAIVHGVGFDGLRAAAQPLDCGNSGTSIRLLMGLCAGRRFETELFGDASLTKRPMRRVADPLRQMGASIDGRSDARKPGDIFPPVRVRGGALTGIRYDLPVASAQLKSALVLAALQANGRTELREPARSRDHTERMLSFLGAPISAAADGSIVIDPTGWNGRLRAGRITIPGDLSSAAFVLIAALIVPGSDVSVENVLEITPTTEAMGEPVGTVRARACQLRGTDVSGELALRAIDEIPALAVAAACADGSTTFTDLAELRVKESDRIVAITRELRRAGVSVEEHPDGLTVTGRAGDPPTGGTVEPEHDHRIAMSGAILGLLSDTDTTVPAADIATSFPNFASTLRALGADI